VSKTIYNTPILLGVVAILCRFFLKIIGWKLQGEPPLESKYVLVAAPHTSNWDFPLGLAIMIVYRLEIRWMGKETLFKGWRGPFMKWLGGIPVNRSSANNMVAQTIDTYNSNESFVVAIPPEGTRSKVERWKTGFYYIAVGADVPIALGFLDYKCKKGGFLSTWYPTGDIEKDIAGIQSCYAEVSGKYAG